MKKDFEEIMGANLLRKRREHFGRLVKNGFAEPQRLFEMKWSCCLYSTEKLIEGLDVD